MTDADLTARQRDVLCAIPLAEGDRPDGRGVHRALDREMVESTFYANLNALADAGLVRLDRPDGDGRAYGIGLTADGVAALRQLGERAERALAAVNDA